MMSGLTEPKLLTNLERYQAVTKAMLIARAQPGYTEAMEDEYMDELDFLWYKKLTPEEKRVLSDEAEAKRPKSKVE